jgi:hypothetical protein
VKPLLTPNGPVFLKYPRYICKPHGGSYDYGNPDRLQPSHRFYPSEIRFGQVTVDLGCCLKPICDPVHLLHQLQCGPRVTPAFLTLLLMTWINSRFVVATVRRDILVKWMAGVVVDLTFLGDSGSLATALPELVPDQRTIIDMLLAICRMLLYPAAALRNKILALLDGCVFEFEF